MRSASQPRAGLSAASWVGLVAFAHFAAAMGVHGASEIAGAHLGIWIANALSTALVLRRGYVPAAIWPALAIAALGANALAATPLAENLAFAAASVVQIALAVRLLASTRAWSREAPEPASFIRAALLGAGLAPLAAASLAAAALWPAGHAPASTFLVWLVSNALGFVVVFPLAALASRDAAKAISGEGRALRLALTVLSCAAVVAVSVAQMKAPYLLVLLPLLAAAVYMPAFDIAILSAATGASFMGMAMLDGMIGAQMTAFKPGFQVPLTITLLFPVLGGLLMEAIRRRERTLSESEERARQAASAVTEAQTRWNFALESAGQGVWDADLETGQTFYSDTWRKMLGYAVGDVGSHTEDWMMLIHPEDRARVREIDLNHVAGRASHFEAEYRIRCKDGRYIWVLDRGRALLRDAEGRCLRAIGTYTDITRHKHAQARIAESAAELRREKELLRVTLKSIGDAVICTDGRDRVTFMNPVAEALTGHSFAEAEGLSLHAIYSPVDEDSGDPIDPFAGAGARTTCGHTGRAVLVGHDGVRRSIREVVTPIASGGAEPAGRVIVFQDYTDARTLQRELAHAASHDALTGLKNRSAFLAAMGQSVDRASKDREPSQLLYIDLDWFKRVNDSAGHAAGDSLLREAAQAIAGIIRKGDVVARLGGDEFAVLLERTDEEHAHRIADAICRAIASVEFEWDGRIYRIGASVGMARVDPGGDVDGIIAAADRACYQAKAAGRGGAVRASAPEAEPELARIEAAA